ATGRGALRRDRNPAPANPENEFVHPGGSEVVGERDARHAARTVPPVRDGERPVPGSRRRTVGELLIVVVVNPAHAQMGIGVDLVIAAKDGLVPGVGTGDLGSVIVAVAAGGGVGRWQEVQDRLAGGIDTAGWDDVAGKCGPGGRIDDG